jgi:hypothetical protein
MAWFLKAQNIYPQSELAKSGVERLLNEILPDESMPKPTISAEGEGMNP